VVGSNSLRELLVMESVSCDSMSEAEIRGSSAVGQTRGKHSSMSPLMAMVLRVDLRGGPEGVQLWARAQGRGRCIPCPTDLVYTKERKIEEDKMRSQVMSATQSAPENTRPNLSTEEIRADATLDLRGLWCPLPPLKTVAALKAMKPGEVLEVLGTNPVGNKVAPWVAQKLGDQLLGFVEGGGGFHRFYFKRSA
jgi:tRNA 2-thiouridine synthesizing protein A